MHTKTIHKHLLAGTAVAITLTCLRGFSGTVQRTLRLHPKRYTPKNHRTLQECSDDLKRDIQNFKRDEAPWEKPVYTTKTVEEMFPELS